MEKCKSLFPSSDLLFPSFRTSDFLFLISYFRLRSYWHSSGVYSDTQELSAGTFTALITGLFVCHPTPCFWWNAPLPRLGEQQDGIFCRREPAAAIWAHVLWIPVPVAIAFFCQQRVTRTQRGGLPAQPGHIQQGLSRSNKWQAPIPPQSISSLLPSSPVSISPEGLQHYFESLNPGVSVIINIINVWIISI